MAEFCLECFRKIDGDMSLTENDVIMDMDLCEGCGGMEAWCHSGKRHTQPLRYFSVPEKFI